MDKRPAQSNLLGALLGEEDEPVVREPLMLPEHKEPKVIFSFDVDSEEIVIRIKYDGEVPKDEDVVEELRKNYIVPAKHISKITYIVTGGKREKQ